MLYCITQEENSFFNLFKEVEEKAMTIKKSDYVSVDDNGFALSSSSLDSLVLDCQQNYSDEKFNKLLPIAYSVFGIKHKIYETAKGGNYNYLSFEDYFSIFYSSLWNALLKYSASDGSFYNYFINIIHYTFLNEKKNSFFKVTGSIPKEKRKKLSVSCIEAYNGYIGLESELDKELMNNELRKIVLNLPKKYHGELLYYMFFSNPLERQTIKNTAKHFEISENQVRNRMYKAFAYIKNTYPDLFDDYYFNEKDNDLPFCDNKNISSENVNAA